MWLYVSIWACIRHRSRSKDGLTGGSAVAAERRRLPSADVVALDLDLAVDRTVPPKLIACARDAARSHGKSYPIIALAIAREQGPLGDRSTALWPCRFAARDALTWVCSHGSTRTKLPSDGSYRAALLADLFSALYYSSCFTVSYGSAPLCGRRSGGRGHSE
jgi:hypothetical protein